MRRALDCYPKKVLRTVNPVKLKNKNQCSSSKGPVKIKDVDKKDNQCQAMGEAGEAKVGDMGATRDDESNVDEKDQDGKSSRG
jgi:hypothetical protein